MDQLITGLGLTWEQIVIAAVCLAVLVGVTIAALRGARRGRRPTQMRTLTLEPMSRRTDRFAERGRGRQGSSSVSAKSAEPERRVEPMLSRSTVEGRASAPPRGGAFDEIESGLQELAQAYADQARTVKILKSHLDELRQTANASARRLDVLEAAVERLRSETGEARPSAVERPGPPEKPETENAPGEREDAAGSPRAEPRDVFLRGERRGR